MLLLFSLLTALKIYRRYSLCSRISCLYYNVNIYEIKEKELTMYCVYRKLKKYRLAVVDFFVYA